MSSAQSKPPRIDLVVDRDPDGDTTVSVFIDGVEIEPEPDSLEIHHIDPGRSGADDEWWEGMTTHGDSTPDTVRSHIESIARLYYEP